MINRIIYLIKVMIAEREIKYLLIKLFLILGYTKHMTNLAVFKLLCSIRCSVRACQRSQQRRENLGKMFVQRFTGSHASQNGQRLDIHQQLIEKFKSKKKYNSLRLTQHSKPVNLPKLGKCDMDAQLLNFNTNQGSSWTLCQKKLVASFRYSSGSKFSEKIKST